VAQILQHGGFGTLLLNLVTPMNLWIRPWPLEWNVPLADDSALRGTFHFAWGNPHGLWQVETDNGLTLADLLQELGQLELKALGRLKHGDAPPERRPPLG
jgi:hypothetical protein